MNTDNPDTIAMHVNNTNAVLHGRVSNHTDTPDQATTTTTATVDTVDTVAVAGDSPACVGSYLVTTTTEVTPDPKNPELCGGSLCVACCLQTRTNWFCALYRETIMGGRRVARCRASQPVTPAVVAPSSDTPNASAAPNKKSRKKQTESRWIPNTGADVRKLALKYQDGYSFTTHLNNDGPYVTVKSAHVYKMIHSYENSALLHRAVMDTTLRLCSSKKQKHIFVFSTVAGTAGFGRVAYFRPFISSPCIFTLTGKTPLRDRADALNNKLYEDSPIITTTAMLDTVLASIAPEVTVHVHWCTLVRSPLLYIHGTRRHPLFCHVYVSNHAQAFEAACLKHIILGLAKQEQGAK